MIAHAFWLGLSSDTRKKLSILLEIPRSGHTEVVDGRVVSDGYTMLDLATVTLEKLQGFMQSDEEDFYKLFNQLITNVEREPVDFVRTPEPVASEELERLKAIEKSIDQSKEECLCEKVSGDNENCQVHPKKDKKEVKKEGTKKTNKAKK